VNPSGKPALNIADPRRPTLPQIAAHYRERQLACVVFTVDAESVTGLPPVPSEEVRDKILEHNAARLLGLAAGGAEGTA